jgi:HlyD family secretion protein
MVIARVDQSGVVKQKEREQAGLSAAQSGLAQSHTAIEYQRAAIEGDLAVRAADLKQAEARLAELLAGSRPEEIQGARAQVQDALTWHEQAKADWERAQALYKDEDISTAQRDQAKTRFDSTAATVKQARERLQLIEAGPRKETIDAARAQVERARAAVQLGEANRIELRRREQEITMRRAEIDRARAGIAIIDTQIDDTTVRSPIEGVVLLKSAEPGEVLAAGATVVTLADLEHPWLRAFVSEKDLGRVKIGAQVKLTTDSYPGKTYMGRISFIASEAEFTPKQIQTRDERVKLVYRIKIDVENPNQELKASMPVDAEIVL